jgi:ubiquinone/menaquinone biosynthesis C-methylase UbiE
MMDMRARMYNRRASGPKSRAEELIKSLELQSGQAVADIGSGGGYFSFRFAQIVGKTGKVYAVDTNLGALNYIRRESVARGVSNLATVAASEVFSVIPRCSLDVVFLRNVYHHLDDPAEYFAEMRKLLKAEGKVVIIDYRGDGHGLSFYKLFKHSVTPQQVKEDMVEAGYMLESSFDYLPEQYFMIFKQKNGE